MTTNKNIPQSHSNIKPPFIPAPYLRPQRYAPSRKCIGKFGTDSPIYIIDPPLPNDNGEYVKYEDYERLKKDNIQLIEQHIKSLGECLRLSEENKKLKGL